MSFKNEFFYERTTNMPKFSDKMGVFVMRFTGAESKSRSMNDQVHVVDVRITVKDSGRYNEFKDEVETRLFPFKTRDSPNIARPGKEMNYYVNDINARYAGYVIFEVLEKALA